MLETLHFQTATLLEGIPHPAMVLDQNCHIFGMNRLMEAITGYDEQKVLGIHGALVLRSNIANTSGQRFHKVLKDGEALSITGDTLNSLRNKVASRYTISPLRNERKDICGLLVVLEDISANTTDFDNKLQPENPQEIIGKSPKMQDVFNLIPLMAQTDASVMITGETGTGKDQIAEIIHKNSPRARFPFIKINCGALPPGLLESELFGHVKGAFTGATRNKPGMFKMAHKGTLFLTEIGDMPLPLQVKLLSVLDDREFVPVGGDQKVSVDVRIIAATHRPLRERIENNEFREDLFYRLHVLHVHLPPLRDREGDVHYLLNHFLLKFANALHKKIPSFSPKTLDILKCYDYPGNIRELKNIIEYAVNVCPTQRITDEHLPPYLLNNHAESKKKTKLKITEQIHTSHPPTPPPIPPTSMAATAPDEGQKTWEEIELKMIIDTLKNHSGNRSKSAETLQWGRMKLWRKMKYYGLLQ